MINEGGLYYGQVESRLPEQGHENDGGEVAEQAEGLSKYHREIKPGVWVDVYDVLAAFDPSNRNAADDRAIKKMLLPGRRGHKDGTNDRKEAIQSLKRSMELIK